MYFKIVTYQQVKHSTRTPVFYIQSKGNHAGRPMRAPKANCWMVETNVPLAFEICTVLWMSRIFEQHIIGSVIPFLRTHDYLKIALPYLAQSAQFEEEVNKSLQLISGYDKLIDNTLSKLKTLNLIKIVTATEVLKKMQVKECA